MGLFFKKKKKNDNSVSIDEAFNRVYKKMDSIDSWEDPKKLEQYILDSCEQIIATTKQIERQKSEYRIVTSYLDDIKAIETAPVELLSDIKETVGRINELNDSILSLNSIQHNVTEEQMLIFAEDEDEMPAVINRMADQEKYLDSLKKEVQLLEGDKSRFEIEREEIAGSKKNIKTFSIAMLVIFGSLMVLFWVLSFGDSIDFEPVFIVLLMIAAITAFGVYIRQSDLRKKNIRATKYLNQSISMLNIARMKYANIQSGLDYTKDKYFVQSSAELVYAWEQYMEKVKDNQRLLKNNDELERYSARLIRLLNQIDINDRKIWYNQTKALVNPDDMAQVKHKLVTRRQKIRKNMEDNRQFVFRERNEIDRLMTEHKHYMPEIQQIIKSVDKICGISK